MSEEYPEVEGSRWARRRVPALRHVKRSELLAREIVEEILARDLEPGDLLPPESAMLARYEVGRASLREALRLLEIQGLVSLKPGPGGGPVVGSVEPANLGRRATLYFRLDGATCGVLAEAMLILDPWLAELAAERSDPERARAVLEGCMTAADLVVDDVAGFWKAAPEFHDAVYELSGNAVLKTTASALGAIFRAQVLRELDIQLARQPLLAAHRDLADAIVASDGPRARKLAYDHMQSIVDTAVSQTPGLLDRVIEWR